MTDIDPALAVYQKALGHQEPMNKVIDRGDSAIQQIYNDTTVFITGGCGFIGKQLIEKLFRACRVKKMFVLVRPKKDKTIQQRIDATLSNPVFDTLREKQPNFSELIVPINGDVSDLKLGLSDEDWKLLTREVNIIFHAAATVRFEEPLHTATITNVRGTRETLTLAKQCKNLIKYVYISTAFSHATREHISKEVLEDFYTSPVPPETMISLAEDVDEKRLNSITMDFIDGWPNTYSFTKAIAEELLRTTAGDLPVCIVRPPIDSIVYHLRHNCLDLCSPQAVWYCAVLEIKNKSLYMILAFFFHYVPAFIVDIICTVIRRKPKEISSFVNVYSKVDKLFNVYSYYQLNEWDFRNDNFQTMIKRMSEADRAIFNCNMNTIDITEYIRVWVVGLRKFILKDGLKNSAAGTRKQQIFGYLNVVVLSIYIYIWWWIFSSLFYMFSKYIC